MADTQEIGKGGASGEPRASSLRQHLPFLSALFLADIAGAFETSMIYAAVKSIIAEFGDPTAVGWMVTIFGLVGAGCAAICGRLGDMYGRRKILIILLAAGTAGSILSAATTNFGLLLVGRGLQGLGAGVLPLLIGLLRQNLPAERVPVAVGLIVSAASAGTAGGLVLGGLLVDHMSWRSLFVASAILGALSTVTVWRLVPRAAGSDSAARLDWLSAILFLPGLALLLLMLGKGAAWGWTDGATLVAGAAGIALLGSWIWRSLRIADPLIDLRLLTNRGVALANIISALVALGALQITLIFSLLLQSPTWTGIGLGVSATVSGLVKLPSNLLGIAVAPFSGWLTQNRGERVPVFVGGIMVIVGWTAMIFWHGSILVVGAILCLIAAGTTILYTAIPNLIVPAVPEARTSEAIGTMSVIRAVAMAAGAQLVTVLLATSTVSKPGESGRYPDAAAFTLTLAVIAALTLCGTAMAFLIKRRR
ncbi:MFS transporter [Sphingopyxis lindanitolerans]|uniref:MFS transporter n=1 Tax=Sphingopyxis lindanitolerans TaxID=2054227 RepID=A0A2S8B5V9_9SPHN|nr:MFS transporter [Sphingopyxis lindanitolerans]PQM27728.1 MFS transporter [Sphingopyxis lindanitolerans]